METQKLKPTFYCLCKFARSTLRIQNTSQFRIQDTSQLLLTHHPDFKLHRALEHAFGLRSFKKYHLKFKENLILNKKYLFVVNIC